MQKVLRASSFLIFQILIILSGRVAIASPIPVAQKAGSELSVFHTRGFNLDSQTTAWQLQVDSVHPDLQATFVSPSGEEQLKVQSQSHLGTDTNLEAYARQWMKDYSAFGFDVMGSKSFTQGQARGYVIDLLHHTQKRELRQVVFVQSGKAVVLTCSPGNQALSQSLPFCNAIVKSFRWL